MSRGKGLRQILKGGVGEWNNLRLTGTIRRCWPCWGKSPLESFVKVANSTTPACARPVKLTVNVLLRWRQIVPVPLVLVAEAPSFEKVPKETAQVVVVRLLVKLQFAAVEQKVGKDSWQASAQLLNGSLQLLLENSHPFLLWSASLHVLPGETANEKVDEWVGQAFEIVATRGN